MRVFRDHPPVHAAYRFENKVGDRPTDYQSAFIPIKGFTSVSKPYLSSLTVPARVWFPAAIFERTRLRQALRASENLSRVQPGAHQIALFIAATEVHFRPQLGILLGRLIEQRPQPCWRKKLAQLRQLD